MWIYVRSSEPGLWTVGFIDSLGKFHTDSDHRYREEAARRVNYLNGGDGKPYTAMTVNQMLYHQIFN